jgi:streptogramin lyase
MRLRTVVAIALPATVCAAALASAPPRPQLATTVSVGNGPCDATVAYGGVWVPVDGAGTLLRIDPLRARVTRTIRVGRTACSVAAGQNSLWVTRYRPSQLVRVDRRTGALRRLELGKTPFDVELTSSVWTTWFDEGGLTRVEPTTMRLLARLPIGGSPAGLALCGDRLWVGGGRRDTWLTVVDPSTNRFRRVDVGVEAPAWPACIGTAVWSPTAHGVVRIDARSREIVAVIELTGTPARVAAAPDGTVWVTDKEQNRVVRIDPATNMVVDEFPAGPGAFALARVRASMWVTSYAGNDVRNYVIAP